MAAAGVIERKGGNIELTLGHGAPLLLCLEQALSGIDLDIQIDVGGGGFAGDDLHHFVTRIALAPRPLMRCLEINCQRGAGKQHSGADQSGGE